MMEHENVENCNGSWQKLHFYYSLLCFQKAFMAISDRDNSLSMFLMEKSVDDLGVGFPQALELSV